MKFNIILTTSANYGVAKFRRLPWNFSEDLESFNNYTKDNICIMGANTARYLLTPLENRINIVISQRNDFHPDFIVVRSFEAALIRGSSFLDYKTEMYVIGGASLINAALESPHLDKIYLTYIHKLVKCDMFVSPILDRSDMTHTILSDKDIYIDDTINAVNMIGNTKVTFYMCTKY